MSVVYKLMRLCQFNDTTITELETNLGFSRGSIKKSSNQTLRSDRVQEISAFFNISPTYLLSDDQYDRCPTCGFSFDPLNRADVELHKIQHENFQLLRSKMGYLMTPAEAECKKRKALEMLKNPSTTDSEKIIHYESLILCEFTEFAKESNYDPSISYLEFFQEQIAKRKYIDLLSDDLFRSISSKHNIDLAINNAPLSVQINSDKEFMQNVADMWRLPQDLKIDVYKAIRHAKRDYQESNTVVF